MKVVCIDSRSCNLTIGKVYDINHMGGYCSLIDDTGVHGYVFTSMFISIEEYRNRKINLILHD